MGESILYPHYLELEQYMVMVNKVIDSDDHLILINQ